jgi:type II secretory pathway component PulJ
MSVRTKELIALGVISLFALIGFHWLVPIMDTDSHSEGEAD